MAPALALEQSRSELSAKAPAVAPSRSDVRLVRNLKRGSASEATASFRQLGAGALIDELVHDRMAQSGVVGFRRFGSGGTRLSGDVAFSFDYRLIV